MLCKPNRKKLNRTVLIAIWAILFIIIPVCEEAQNDSLVWFWISLEKSFLHGNHLLSKLDLFQTVLNRQIREPVFIPKVRIQTPSPDIASILKATSAASFSPVHSVDYLGQRSLFHVFLIYSLASSCFWDWIQESHNP